MINRQVTKEINGRNYQIITMNTTDSLNLLSDVTSLVDLSGSDEKGAAGIMVGMLGNPKMLPVIKKLFRDLTFEGRTIEFDAHFADYRKDLLPCVSFSLSENVLPFFDPDSLAQMATMIAEAMDSFQEI